MYIFIVYLSFRKAPVSIIKFTSEIEQNGNIAFLDINITNNQNGFKTSIYRKPTFTGLTTKFSSFAPMKYKRNLVATLVYRAYHLCSSYESIDLELNEIKNFLNKNGFPQKFLDTWIGKTLNKLINPPKKESLISPERKPVFFCMPFLGTHSFQIKKRLTKLLLEFYPQVSLRMVFTSHSSIGSYFRFKDRIPEDLRSSIVYLYKCDSCNASYIGKCERHLRTRTAEHEGRSVRTGCFLSKPSHSAIRDHCHTHDHLFSKQNFSILGSTRDKLELTIMEALFQHLKKSSLGRPLY